MDTGTAGTQTDGTHKADAIPRFEVLQAYNPGNPSMRGNPTAEPAAGDVIERLRQVFGVKTDIELAAALGLGKSAPSNWRQRNSTPYDICAVVSSDRGISLDWLIFGAERPSPGAIGAESAASQLPQEAARLVQFVMDWAATRSPAELTWLEQTVRRAVPEYAEWAPASRPQ